MKSKACFLAVGLPLLLFLAIISTGFDGKPYLRGDCPYYVFAARSIIEDHDLDMSNQLPPPLFSHNTNISLDMMGRPVPKHPLWLSIAAIPLLLAFNDTGALVFNMIQLEILCLLAFLLARRVAGPWTSAIAVCLTVSLSFLPHYAWNFSPDVLTAVLLAGGLLLLPADRSPLRGRHFFSGILFGLAMTAKPSFALALPGLVWLIGRPLKRSVPAFLLGILLPVAVWMGINQHLFGSPLITPYDRIVHFNGSRIELHSQREDFHLPGIQNIYELMFMPAKGMAPTSPITVFSFLLLPFLWPVNRSWTLYIMLTSALIYMFYASYAPWVWSSWGDRFLMPLIIFGTMPLAAALSRWSLAKEDRVPLWKPEHQGERTTD